MNREILFRGKRIDNGEWVEGGTYLHDTDLETVCIGGYDYYTNEDGLQREEYCCEVDTSTVCQYTNLVDKNGRKIFEGDILSFFACGVVYKGEARFVGGNYKFLGEKVSMFLDDSLEKYYAVVIGNVFDNPELIH